ncbi:hypothetical protein MA785_000773 [Vibrio parahaemolyticus]|nr:hypothetical protein [Vibrio parahaemolyticus]EJR2787882.1 hypothetical protein [Vibrio parahaemolyticus]
MAVTHYSVYRSGNYKAVKEAVDNATELNSINVSKRYYSDKVEESSNKTFAHYLLDELIKVFGSDFYYRTEVVEVYNPIKSKLHATLQTDQDMFEGFHIRDFEHLFEINVEFVANLYPARFESFDDLPSLLEYLRSYPTIDYLFKYQHIEEKKGLKLLQAYIKKTIVKQ